MYMNPILSMCTGRSARLSLIHCIEVLSRHMGSSCGYPDIPGRQVQSLLPARKIRYSAFGSFGSPASPRLPGGELPADRTWRTGGSTVDPGRMGKDRLPDIVEEDSRRGP